MSDDTKIKVSFEPETDKPATDDLSSLMEEFTVEAPRSDSAVPMGEDGLPQYTIADKKNYGGSMKLNDREIKYFTASQMKSLYPRGKGKPTYNIVGEFLPGTKAAGEIGHFIWNRRRYRVFKAKKFTRLTHSVKGCMAIEGKKDSYIAVISDALLPRLIIILALVLAIGAAAIFLPQYFSSKTPNAVDLESGAVPWTGTLPQETGGVEEGIRIPGYKSITVAANTTDVMVSFVNPEQNNCYFVISIVLTDTNETIYQSKMISPGLGLYAITLNRALDPGTYNAAVVYDTYTLTEEPTPLNGARVNIELIAQ